MATTEQLLKARLAELIAERDALQAEAAPHRAKIDAAYEAIQKIKDGIESDRRAVLALNAKTAPIENEISKLARATGGRVMSEA